MKRLLSRVFIDLDRVWCLLGDGEKMAFEGDQGSCFLCHGQYGEDLI